jgi:glutaredoxin
MPPMEPSAAPRVVLYGTPGCHLCDDARAALVGLLADRRAAGRAGVDLVDVDIAGDPAHLRAFMESIPVVEIGARRLELATSPARLRAFVAAALDGDAEDPRP